MLMDNIKFIRETTVAGYTVKIFESDSVTNFDDLIQLLVFEKLNIWGIN
ncbi:TPA: hypothetical protein VCA04_001179 [Streptococcus suis]|uniref:Uncharacterized protein n=1 Tax=Streptococcus suis TaxID=1307 RepID=A0A0Z8C6F1_STRSU|nr:hypothetical protein [Streptococcus suis]MCK4041584.1 hypothetical protein [Streptococcus suis]NQI12474.1 hypothetical protein [Streptococcus suis]NQS07378.1 hypothetical protein [Streptococcus suis]CYU19642.1 Uncharacterised protein [Streptococcus suis]HEL2274395.1 hypothetical protein [Streptococcus suis]